MNGGTVAWTVVRLKLSLLRGGLRLGVWQVVGTVLAWLVAAGVGGLVVLGGVVLRTVDAELAGTVAVLVGVVLVAGWTVVPVLTAGIDDTLEPGRFALVPLPARTLLPGLTLAAVVGAPGLVAVCAGVALVLVSSRGVLATLVAVPAAVLAVLTCVIASRLSTTVAGRVLGGRRAREATTVVTVVVISLLGLVPLTLSTLTLTAEGLDRFVGVVGWTPLGLAWAAPGAVAAGDLGAGLAHLALAAGVVGLGLAAWLPLLRRDLESPLSSGGPATSVQGGVLDRVPTGPTWAVAARRLSAWRRDPRYVMALIAPVAACAAPVAISLTGTDGSGRGLLLITGPIVALLLGLTSTNDVGYDGSAFAAHLVTGVPGRADRLGRTLGTLVVAWPFALVAGTLGTIASGHPDLLPGMLGVCTALLLAGVGAGCVSGAVAAYPMPEAGSNPFRSNSGATGRALVGQLLSMGATGAAAAPAIGLTVAAALVSPWFGLGALVAGVGLGLAVLALGVVVGGRVVDARGPELLAAVSRPG